MAPSDSVFAVIFVCRGVGFRVGFCVAYVTLPGAVWPVVPFGRTSVAAGLGAIECRGRWRPPEDMTAEQYSFCLHPYQPWMRLTVDEVLAAATYCESIRMDLPPEGFRRSCS